MIIQIGIVAGEVWHYLEHKKGTDTLQELVKSIKKPRDIILMSVGWLAREGHIVLEGDPANQRITLRA